MARIPPYLAGGMATQAGKRSTGNGAGAVALAPLAQAGQMLAERVSLGEALAAIVEAVALSTGADIAVIRIADPEVGSLLSRAVWSSSAALAAELEGSRFPLHELPEAEVADPANLPHALRRAAERWHTGAVLQIPVRLDGAPVASVELFRAGRPFSPDESALANLAASQVGLAIRMLGLDASGSSGPVRPLLELAGDALSAVSDGSRTAEQVARVAAEVTRASACRLWLADAGEPPVLVSSFGFLPDEGVASAAASRALREHQPVWLEPTPGAVLANLRLGEPPLGVLQLAFPPSASPSREQLARLATFGVRAAHALRASARLETVTLELERTRALLAVVGQAISQLSLAHTLETAVERVAALLGVERVAVYLNEDQHVLAAAGRALEGPHVRVAERLLELGLGPFRGGGVLVVEDMQADERVVGVAGAAAESGIEAAAALPLLAHDDVIGLLAVYPAKGRMISANETALLSALTAQLAVAVQNARLHEQTKRLKEDLEGALTSERQSARQLRALYEISRSFAQSLSLEATLDAVASTVVELLHVDAAVIRMPDARREFLEPQALHIADSWLSESIKTVLRRPQPSTSLPMQRLFRTGEPLVLEAATAGELTGSHALLVPFLEAGSTAAVIPIATPAEVLAALTILSLDPERPITDETVDTAMTIAGQAALAIDNARLYQNQKDFSDTMQRSLLPRSQPRIEGIEVGDVYAPSSHVEVGGDVYDFMPLADGRLAVVLGDVTGHGIEATADMAMAKFVFRSLAREHPEPSDFLAYANEVVVGEIAPGKFITMAYMTIEPGTGEVAYASAGHPAPRVVLPDGNVGELYARGLPLGIDNDQEYPDVRELIPAGAAVVLYTDGVVEARQEGELYGVERLDALLSNYRDLPALEIAQAVIADCRAFGGGELADDCAIVVIKRT